MSNSLKRIFITVVFVYSFTIVQGQRNPLEVFKPFIGKTWKASGKWGDGKPFIQELTFKYSLAGNIVIVESQGFVDQKLSKIGHRNHGVRKFDPVTGSIKFWEFDIFGGLTEGNVVIEGKNILYRYPYGESMVTDMWEYVDENTYNFKIGSYIKGKWDQVYLETKFSVVQKDN